MGVIDSRRLSPADKVLSMYLLATAPLFLASPDEYTPWRILFHLLLPVLIWGLRVSPVGGSRVGSVFLDLLPAVMFVYCYTEMPILNRALHPGVYFDAAVIQWEQSLLGGQPAMSFREALPYRWLDEYLHLGYFSYYLYVPILIVGTWWSSGRRALQVSLGTLGVTYFVGFVIFILFPVAGPYYEFPRMDLSEGSHTLAHLVRWVLDRGASIGTAFPSSHTSVAVTVWILCIRYCKPAAWLLLALVPAMALGAVYGGYHYSVDIMTGALLGLLCSTLGFRWIKTL